MVVLDKVERDAGLRKNPFLVTLQEKASFILEDFRFDDQNAWKGSGGEVQGKNPWGGYYFQLMETRLL